MFYPWVLQPHSLALLVILPEQGDMGLGMDSWMNSPRFSALIFIRGVNDEI